MSDATLGISCMKWVNVPLVKAGDHKSGYVIVDNNPVPKTPQHFLSNQFFCWFMLKLITEPIKRREQYEILVILLFSNAQEEQGNST